MDDGVTAMGQMFYSLSIAMGILVTFGSYMKKDTSIEDRQGMLKYLILQLQLWLV
mgnify:CR=1 FL=1